MKRIKILILALCATSTCSMQGASLLENLRPSKALNMLLLTATTMNSCTNAGSTFFVEYELGNSYPDHDLYDACRFSDGSFGIVGKSEESATVMLCVNVDANGEINHYNKLLNGVLFGCATKDDDAMYIAGQAGTKGYGALVSKNCTPIWEYELDYEHPLFDLLYSSESVFRDVDKTPDGGAIFAGNVLTVSSLNGGALEFYTYIYAVSVSALGNKRWDKLVKNDNDPSDQVQAVVVYENNAYIGGSTGANSQSMLVLSLDLSGDLKSSTRYPTNENAIINGMVISDGKPVFVATEGGNVLYGKIDPSNDGDLTYVYRIPQGILSSFHITSTDDEGFGFSAPANRFMTFDRNGTLVDVHLIETANYGVSIVYKKNGAKYGFGSSSSAINGNDQLFAVRLPYNNETTSCSSYPETAITIQDASNTTSKTVIFALGISTDSELSSRVSTVVAVNANENYLCYNTFFPTLPSAPPTNFPSRTTLNPSATPTSAPSNNTLNPSEAPTQFVILPSTQLPSISPTQPPTILLAQDNESVCFIRNTSIKRFPCTLYDFVVISITPIIFGHAIFLCVCMKIEKMKRKSNQAINTIEMTVKYSM